MTTTQGSGRTGRTQSGRKQGELTEEQQQVAGVYSHVLKRGRRQAQLVKALMERGASASGDLDAGIRAARRTAAFVAAERWVVGPVWVVSGPQWLLARWALDHDVTSEAISRRMGELRDEARNRRAPAAEAGQAQASQAQASADPARARGRGAKAPAGARSRQLVTARREADALEVLFQHLLVDDPGIEDAVEAAQRTAQFAVQERWLGGSMWHAYGMQLVLARWAITQGVASSDIDLVMAARREPAQRE